VPTYHLQLGVGIRQKDNFNLKWTIQWEFLTLDFFLKQLILVPMDVPRSVLNFIRIFMELFLSQNFDNSTPCYQWQHRVKTPCCCYNSEAKLYVLSSTKKRCSSYHFQRRAVIQTICENAPSLFMAESRCFPYLYGRESVTTRVLIAGNHCLKQGVSFQISEQHSCL
jgi:hypothetical protein